MVSLFRQIVQRSPPIAVLNMQYMQELNGSDDKEENMGVHVLEALLSANIETITDLNLSSNESWFKDLATQEDI